MIIIPTREEFLRQVAEDQITGNQDDDFLFDDPEEERSESEEPFLGSEQHKYLLSQAAKIPMTPGEDLMTMAQLTARDRNASWKIEKRQMVKKEVSRQLDHDADRFDVAPMQSSRGPKEPRLDRFLNSMLGVMAVALIICVAILIFAWR